MASAACLLLLLAFALGAHAAPMAFPLCRIVMRQVSPCFGYLTNRELRPVDSCCMGTAAMERMVVVGGADRHVVCECLKGMAARIMDLDVDRAARLPGACGFNLTLPISANADCSTIPV